MIVWAVLALSVLGLVASLLYGRRKQPGSVMWRRVVVLWAVIVSTVVVAVVPIGLGGRTTRVTNRDIILVIDLTLSVNALDSRDGGEGTRLDDIKTDMRAIAENQAGANIGILTFSDRSELYMPLTANSADVNSAIDTLYTASSNESISKTAAFKDVFTATGDYLSAQRQTDPTRERVVVFMSDFEVFKQQETDGDIIAAAAVLSENGASYVGMHYGSGQPVKILSTGFNYLTGNFEPTYVTQKSELEGLKFLQDNYKTVYSTSNSGLSEQIARQINGQSVNAYKKQDYVPAIESAARSASAASLQTSEAIASKQQLLYVVPATVGFVWLVLVELVKPSWVMKRLSRSRSSSGSNAT